MERNATLLRGARDLLSPTVARFTALNLIWWVAFGRMVAARVRDQKLAQVASSLTFTTVLSLVPMVTVALAIFTVFPGFAEFQDRLQGYIVDNFLPPNMASTIQQYINQFANKAKRLTAFGMGFLVVTAMTTMFTVDRVFNDIWHVRRPRSWVAKFSLYWCIITLSPLLIGASLSISSWLLKDSLSGMGELHGIGGALLAAVPWLLTVLAFTLLYVTIPNRPVRWSDGLLGGALAALLFEAFKGVFAYYVTHSGTYTRLYGALAAFPVFLLWIYLSWIIVLLGATVVAALPIARTGHFNHVEKPGERWVLGLRIMAELERARRLSEPGLTLERLRVLSDVPPDALDEILDILVDKNFVGLVKPESGAEQYALVCDPHHVSVETLAKVLWFDAEVLDVWRVDLPQASLELDGLVQARLSSRPLIEWLK